MSEGGRRAHRKSALARTDVNYVVPCTLVQPNIDSVSCQPKFARSSVLSQPIDGDLGF
jgi:hypothetical protein